MKNIIIKYSYFILLLAVLATACEKRLQLEPQQSLSEDAAFVNGAAAESSLLGVYSQAQLLEVFGSQPQIIQDYMADNTFFVGSFPTLQEINNYAAVSPNVSIQSWWQVHYRAINGANTVIDKVPSISDPSFTEAKARQLIAEAKFMRAIMYFQLVNIFAQPYQVNNGNSPGVPLVLQGFTGVVSFPSRASVNEVHAQIRRDLEEAIPDLPVSYSSAIFTRGRATKGAAAGFLSRLHLYRGEWQEAANRATEVLNNSLYAPASDLSFYNALTSEDVFVIYNSAIDNPRTGSGGWASYHRPATQGGRGDCPFADELVAAFAEEAGDKRFTELSDVVVAADNSTRRMTLKFPDAVTNSDNAPLLRVSEIMLSRAEALAEMNGVNQESIDLVNPIRERAGLPAWDLGQFASKEAFIDAILNERRKELCFEGHRRLDLLRRGQPLRTSGVTAPRAVFGGPYTIMPIPNREIDLNPNLTQNPGY
jgi:starch-binding outer membrane protein, SusD/RagB family